MNEHKERKAQVLLRLEVCAPDSEGSGVSVTLHGSLVFMPSIVLFSKEDISRPRA